MADGALRTPFSRENVGDEPAGGLRKGARAGVGGFGGLHRAWRSVDAAAGDGGVGVGEVEQAHVRVADRDAGAVRLRGGRDGVQPEGVERGVEADEPDLRHKVDEGDVEGEHERVGSRNGTPEAAVEVDGREAAGEVARRVEERLVGPDDSLVEGGGEDEGLERGAGGAGRERGVDLAFAVGEVIAGAGEGAHGAGSHVEEDAGGGAAEFGGAFVDAAREGALERGVEGRRVVSACARQRRLRPIREIRLREGAGCAAHDKGGRFGALLLRFGDHAEGEHAAEDVFPAAQRGGQVAVGAEAGGRLNHAGEQRGLSEAERLGGFAEPAHGAGLDADEIRGHRRAVEVLLDDRELRHGHFEAQRLEGFDVLPSQGTRMRRDEAHGLRGDRGGAGNASAGRDVLPHGAQKRKGVDAPMAPEALVFGGDEGLNDPVFGIGAVPRAAVLVVRPEADA